VGLSINDDLGITEKDPNCGVVDEFVDHVMGMYYKYKNISKPKTAGYMMYINMLAVHPDFTKRRIGYNLIQKSVQHAQAEGFNIIWTFATSPTSTNLFQKNNFIKAFQVEYKEYLSPITNTYVFANGRYPICIVFEYI